MSKVPLYITDLVIPDKRLDPEPWTLNPEFCTLDPIPCVDFKALEDNANPKPYTPNPKPETLNAQIHARVGCL